MNSTPPAILNLRVVEARALNPVIRTFRLQSARRRRAARLHRRRPPARARRLPGGAQDWRHYSLINLVPELHSTDAPTEYVIAVRVEADGRGGSRCMHQRVKAGDPPTVETPKNDCSLHDCPERAVLIAGGIGITPLASMAARRRAHGLAVTMHYPGGSRELMAYLPELKTLLDDALLLHTDAEACAPLDIAALMVGCTPQDRLYVCGPRVLLDAVLAQRLARGWSYERVHFELFTTPVVEDGDHAFELVLGQSGQSFTEAANQAILDCLIDHGCDSIFDCKRGECGECAAPVMEGEIDHRDYVLSAREKAAGNVIQICVSRAMGARHALDM